MIAFDAEVLEAVGKGRLRVRLPNGHPLVVRGPSNGAPAAPGDRGLATLPTGPAVGWRFVAAV